MALPRLVIVPGLGDNGPEHWQSLWERKYGAARVRQDDPENPTPETWAARLQEVIGATPGELVLIGHSTGVLNIVHWARLYGGHRRVRGALLVGPTDPEAMGTVSLYPVLGQMAPLPLQPLPFPALVVASENDPFVTFARAEEMADAWDAGLANVGEASHISFENGGFGEWPAGEVLLSECLHAWSPPEISGT